MKPNRTPIVRARRLHALGLLWLACAMAPQPSQAGTLRATGGNVTIHGTVTVDNLVVESGAVWRGDGQLVGNADVSGVASPGSPPSSPIGTLSVAGSVVFRSGSVFEASAATQTDVDRIDATGLIDGTCAVAMSAAPVALPLQRTILSGDAASDYSNFSVQNPGEWQLTTTGYGDLVIASGGEYATLSGTVTEADGGNPIQGVSVYVHGTWRSAVSDALGRYTITRVIPGSYAIHATPDTSSGFVGQWYPGVLYTEQRTPPPGATNLTLQSGAALDGIDFALNRGARISGTVTGGGLALAGSRLKAVNATYGFTRTAIADGQGRYDLSGLLPGDYTLKAEAESFADEWWDNANHRDDASPFVLGFGDEVQRDFDLAAGQSPARIEVTSDPAGAQIYLDYWPTGEVTPAVVDVGEVGTWDAAGNRLASHVITLKKPGVPQPSPRTVAATEAETVVEHFDLTSGASGTVMVQTIPAGAEVFVDYADNAAGVTPLVVGNLAPGSHTILLRKAGYLQPRPLVAGAAEGSSAYAETSQAGTFAAEGSLWRSGMDQVFALGLPFDFPFHGIPRSVCYVDIHGAIRFTSGASDWNASEAAFAAQPMIAAMWGDFYEYGSPIELWLQTGTDNVTVQWRRGSVLNVSATLRSDGRIDLKYGAGNAHGGLVGVSAGDGATYTLAATSQSGSMAYANDVLFAPPPAMVSVEVALTRATAPERLMADVRSEPQGVAVYVDYLPTAQVTDVVVATMDPASHAGSGWHSASHTILLRDPSVRPYAPRYVPDEPNVLHELFIRLPEDVEGARDSNGDGIPDWWCEIYELDPYGPSIANLTDGSGLTYLEKFRAGLIPGDPNSRFTVKAMAMGGNAVQGRSLTFVFDTVPGKRYVVQGRASLTEGRWEPVSGVLLADGAELYHTAVLPEELAGGFFRVSVLFP